MAEKVKVKARMGRPPAWNMEIAQKICDIVATTSKGITKICQENDGFPNPDTVYQWLAKRADFSEMYAQAKRSQIEVFVEELTNIADKGDEDYLIDHEGGHRPNPAKVARDKLRIDTRKWLACKLVPRLYGDRVQHEGAIKISYEDKLKELE